MISSHYYEYTVWRETLEGANFGEFARKTSLVELTLAN